jgi:hypothetical protein
MVKTRTPISKIKFHSINRDVRAAVATNSYNANRIAGAQNVSAESVRSVKRTGTWPKFLEYKKANRSRQIIGKIARGKAAIAKADGVQHRPIGSFSAKPAQPTAYDEAYRGLEAKVARLQQQVQGEEERLDRVVDWVAKIDKRASKRWWNR